MKKPARIIGLIATLLLVGVLFVSFLYYQKNLRPVFVTSATQSGRHLEEFLPAASNFFVFVDAQNADQRAKTDELLKGISGETSQFYINQFADNLIKDGTLTSDAATALSKSPRIAIGGVMPVFSLNSKRIAKKADDPQKNPVKDVTALYVAFEVPNAVEIANSVNALPDAKQLDPKSSKKKIFAQAVDDVLIFSTDSTEKLQALTHRKFWENISLSQTQNFKNYAVHFEKNSLANLYIELQPAIIVASASAAENGFNITSWSTFVDYPDATKKLVELYSKEHKSLINNVPTNGLLLFAENFDLAAQFSFQPQIGETIAKITGIDLEKDIGDAVVDFIMQDAGLPIPTVSLYVDGGASNSSSALSSDGMPVLLKKIDEQLNKLIVFANYSVKTDPSKGPFITREKLINTGISATRVTLHPENVADGTALPPIVQSLSSALTLTYGTIHRGDFGPVTFVSTNPFIIENLTSPALFGVGTESLEKYRAETYKNGGLTYISIDKLGDSVARFMELLDSTSVTNSQQSGSLRSVATELRKKLQKFGGLFAVTGTDGEGLVQKIVLKIVK